MQRVALATGLLVATTALVRGEDCNIENEDLSLRVPPQCTECADPVTDGCKTCEAGFYLVTDAAAPGKCAQCPEKCKTCSDADTCTECNENYVGADCKPCAEATSVEGCGKCADETACTECSADLVAVKDEDGKITGCKSCAEATSVEGCGKCADASECTECSANHETIKNEEDKITECKRNGATSAGSATLAVLASFAAATLAALI